MQQKLQEREVERDENFCKWNFPRFRLRMAAFSIDGGLASPSEPREVVRVSKFSSGWDCCENCIGSSWDCHRFKRWDCQSLCPQAENFLKYSQVLLLLFALRLLSDWGLAGWQRGMYLAPEMLRVVRCLNQWRVWVGKLPDLVSHRSMAHGPSVPWYAIWYEMVWLWRHPNSGWTQSLGAMGGLFTWAQQILD